MSMGNSSNTVAPVTVNRMTYSINSSGVSGADMVLLATELEKGAAAAIPVGGQGNTTTGQTTGAGGGTMTTYLLIAVVVGGLGVILILLRKR